MVIKVSDEFEKSQQDGFHALSMIGIAAVSFFGFVAIVVAALEALLLYRARAAAGTKELVLMNMTVNSYQQAYALEKIPVFFPKQDQGVYVALQHGAVELYAGFFRAHVGPRLRIKYSNITSMRQSVVQIFGAKVPGIVFETDNGPFELGFVKVSVMSVGRVRKATAERRFKEIESAWLTWREAQE